MNFSCMVISFLEHIVNHLDLKERMNKLEKCTLRQKDFSTQFLQYKVLHQGEYLFVPFL